ncbi:hypothetical protein ECPA48_4265 [Escherichia coli PA48]|nr:hypothetical protein ECH7EC4196_4873 [Escherichia coli O157:H7 str. EC4196]EIN56715.1 hypothetical protein ECPA9_5153 [Escherichia coli PA9]EKI60932.1 hypothetical protein ECEC1737_4951 [Escherichia coli EC1737]EKJ49062.1 hypothetical protein ECFRIK523_4986 [Escherichia coli FRIK523]EKK73066.1 hypothetical protein EC80416_4559 [Escherichia coli 8.0416]EKV87107.1 hypothetical protein EC900091_5354 [Escherichia coli 90.0091]EKW70592.1 hypothetical protein EC971742_4526 [Escherichia coli 97.1
MGVIKLSHSLHITVTCLSYFASRSQQTMLYESSQETL